MKEQYYYETVYPERDDDFNLFQEDIVSEEPDNYFFVGEDIKWLEFDEKKVCFKKWSEILEYIEDFEQMGMITLTNYKIVEVEKIGNVLKLKLKLI